jgi:hypothetical protein
MACAYVSDAWCQLFDTRNLTPFLSVDLLELRGLATIQKERMAKAIGFILALVALVAGILCAVDPVTCVWRAGVAFFAGWLGATVWHGVFVATSRITFVAGQKPRTGGVPPTSE